MATEPMAGPTMNSYAVVAEDYRCRDVFSTLLDPLQPCSRDSMAVDWDRGKVRRGSAPETAPATAVAIGMKGIYRTSDSGAERTVTLQAEESVSLGDNTLREVDLAR
jgi:hypothetical protein